MRIAILYLLFALMATAANIGSQHLVVLAYQGWGQIAASMVAGTGVGLVVKYVLDKRYIFRFQARSVAHEGGIFMLYTLMGLATTAVFWITELSFYWIFETDRMRYVGGSLGLAIGYLVKYQLDKKFVFAR